MNNNSKPRIVLYGLGQYGLLVARFAWEKDWPIVAAFNRAGSKVGQDLGQLAGFGEDIGVVVQDADTANFDNLEADIGVVAITDHLAVNMPAYQRLLSAGLNVICHGVEAYYPYGNDAKLADEINTLALANNVSFSGSGIWDMSRIWSGILTAGPCTEITSMFHRSVTEATRGGREILLRTGVGQTVAEFEKNTQGSTSANAYKTINEHVLTGLGYTIVGTQSHIEPVVAEQDTECEMYGETIPAGDCIGTRCISETTTEEGITAKSHVEVRLIDGTESEHTFWSVDGKPVNRMRLERENSQHATASSLFNRIPDVIAARPGIVTISELGPPKHTALA